MPGEQLLCLSECYGQRHIQPGDRPPKALSPPGPPGLPASPLSPSSASAMVPEVRCAVLGAPGSWEAHPGTGTSTKGGGTHGLFVSWRGPSGGPVGGSILPSKALYCTRRRHFPALVSTRWGSKGKPHEQQGRGPSSPVEVTPQSGQQPPGEARFSLAFPFPPAKKVPRGLKKKHCPQPWKREKSSSFSPAQKFWETRQSKPLNANTLARRARTQHLPAGKYGNDSGM